jgi:biotin carboxylase
LTDAGIPVARYRYVENDQEIGKRAEEIGYPVVLKLDCSKLPHITDPGPVILNIRDEQELKRGVEKFEQILKTRDVGRKRGIFIQEMIPYGGLEVILGGGIDPHLGPYIKAGAGGPAAESMDATSIRPAPITEERARQMLEENGLQKLLQGYRGLNGDIEALCAAMVRLSHLLLDLGSTEIREMDLNPVFVLPEGQGIKVIDFRITLAPEEKEEARA